MEIVTESPIINGIDAIIEVSKSVYGNFTLYINQYNYPDLLFTVNQLDEDKASYGTSAEAETEKVGLRV